VKLKRIASLLSLTILLGGSAMAVEGCFVGGPPAPAYGYASPSYVAPGPVAYGDWDEGHVWHNRDWWVANRRPWVQAHHQEWLGGRLAHEDHAHHEYH
jgi:hypothetical protein